MMRESIKDSKKSIFKLLIPVFTLLLCNSCNKTNHQTLIRNRPVKKIEVNIENIKKNISFFNVTNGEVDFIQLKTPENKIFDDIDIFKTDKEHFYTYYETGKALYCFSKKGAFLFSIDKLGHGPGEMASFVDFLINPFSKTIEIMDRKNSKILSYSQNGAFVKETKYDFEGHYFEAIDSTSYAIFSNYQVNAWSPPGNLFFVNTAYQKTESFLPIDKRFINLSFLHPVRFTRNKENNCLFTETHGNNVYEISNHKPVLKYQIDFGKNNIPMRVTDILPENQKIKGIERINKQKKYFEVLEKQGYCYMVENLFEGKQYLGFKFMHKKAAQLYLKNKDSNKALIFENSFLFDNTMQLFKIEDILLMQDDMIYAYTRAEDLLKYKKELEAKYTLTEINEQNTQYPYLKTIYELATLAHDGSSPILLKIKLDF